MYMKHAMYVLTLIAALLIHCAQAHHSSRAIYDSRQGISAESNVRPMAGDGAGAAMRTYISKLDQCRYR